MTSRPASYRSQPACANCVHVHVEMDYEAEDDPYCMFGTSESIPDEEDFDDAFPDDFEAKWTAYQAAMNEWIPRRVAPNGICSHYSKSTEPCPAVQCPPPSHPGTPPPTIQAPPSSPEPNEPK